MHRLWFLGLILVGTSCSKSPDGAVHVYITYGSYTPACIRVTATDSLGRDAATEIIKGNPNNLTDGGPVNVAVFLKSGWTRELTIEVASYDAVNETGCSGTVVEQHRSAASIEVPTEGFMTYEVTLAASDDDHDNYILKVPGVTGTDCDDKNANIHPGLPEVCRGTVDIDCDGSIGCADPDCLSKECDDRNPCTLDDQCKTESDQTATCAGTPKMCEPPNLACYTSESSCNPATGECVHTQQPPDKSCDDHDACTTPDQCGIDAACKGTPAVSCNSPPNMMCYQSVGTCNAATGTCWYVLKDSTATCDDSDACTENDRCNGFGDCNGQPLAPCVPSDVCRLSSRNCPGSASCVESVDTSKVYKPCTTPTRDGVCRNDGICSSFPYIPSNFDPDAIAKADRELNLHINCGGPMDPVIFDSSMSSSWTVPKGCTLPPLPAAQIIGGVAVLPIRNLIIDATRVLKIKGTLPVILAVYENATLSGALLADADHEVPGAGGNRSNCGDQSGGNGAFSYGEGSGGGGGGFGTAGAAGGLNISLDAGGKGGAHLNSTLVPLTGGCPGGSGGSDSTLFNGGAGGAGGGALQLAVAKTLKVDSVLSVSGGGGQGGRGTSNNAGGGGGGGSGGALLLEAFRLELTDNARLTANGGGGAEGGDSDLTTGAIGNDGSQFSMKPALGSDNGGDGAPGGDGGAEGKPPTPPKYLGIDNAGGGGGGGAVGVIRLLGFRSCAIHESCDTINENKCGISPTATPACP